MKLLRTLIQQESTGISRGLSYRGLALILINISPGSATGGGSIVGSRKTHGSFINQAYLRCTQNSKTSLYIHPVAEYCWL